MSVSAVSDTEIASALACAFKDFEDSIQHFAAKAEGGIDAIITRNPNEYIASEIRVFSPEQFLAEHYAIQR